MKAILKSTLDSIIIADVYMHKLLYETCTDIESAKSSFDAINTGHSDRYICSRYVRPSFELEVL